MFASWKTRRVSAAFRLARPARENFVGAAILFVIVVTSLAPFFFGDRTLQTSATDTPSLFSSGGRFPRSTPITSLRVLDPGAPSWLSEPMFLFEHNTLVGERTLPLWTPYSAFGMPVAADMQSQPFSPFAWPAEIAPSARTWNLFVILRLYAAGLFAFLFLRCFGGLFPSLVGGAAYMYAGYIWLYVSMPHLSVEVLIPALLLAVELFLRRTTIKNGAILSISLSAMIFGGMPESTLLAVTFAVLFALVRLRSVEEFRGKALRIVMLGTGAAIVSAAICAIQLLPFLEYMRISSNTHAGVASVVGLGFDGFSWDFPALYLAPLMHGPPWANIFHTMNGDTGVRGFFGCTAAFLGLVAVLVQAQRMLPTRTRLEYPIFFFALVAAALLCKRFGVWPMSQLGALPGFSLVVFPKYEEAIIGLCVAMLAGFGAMILFERNAASPATIALAVGGPLSLLTIAAGVDKRAFFHLGEPNTFYLLGLAAALAFLGAITIVALAARLRPTNARIGGAIAAALVCIELNAVFVVPLYYVINGNTSDTDSAYTGTKYVDFLKTRTKDGDRFYAQDQVLYPDWSSAFAIPDVRALDAVYPERYIPYVEAFFPPPAGASHLDRVVGFDGTTFRDERALRFLTISSVKYVGAATDAAFATSGAFTKVFGQPGASIFQYSNPLPRVAVYRHVLRASSADEARSLLTSAHFDPRREAIVEADAADAPSLPFDARTLVATGRITTYQSRFARATVDADAKSLVVLNDTVFPGWRATLDGSPAKILHANYLFRGVLVGPGHHVLEFRYDPASAKIGLALSVAGSVVVGLALVLPLFIGRAVISSLLRDDKESTLWASS